MVDDLTMGAPWSKPHEACSRGHRYDEWGALNSRGRRFCLICHRARGRANGYLKRGLVVSLDDVLAEMEAENFQVVPAPERYARRFRKVSA